MKTGKMMKLCSVLLAVTLAGSVTMAGDRGRSRCNDRDDHGGSGRSYHGYYDSGRHYGYSRNSHGELVFGLLGIGMAAAIISTINHPTVYVEPPPVVVQQPRVVYVERPPVVVEQPRIVYVENPQVIQQPVVVQVDPPKPETVTINIQNSNGSFTPVILHPAGSQWVGPRGEYYDSLPTVKQLRPVYGF